MRLISRVAPLALALLAGATGVAHAQGASAKIAYVNTDALLQAAPGRAEAASTFQREAEGYRGQLQKLSDSITTMITAYQKAEPALTAAQKDTRTKAIRALQEQAQNTQQELQQKAAQRENELMAPIMERVKKVLDDIRAEDGYSLIIAGDPSLILSADKNLDITDRVVARLKTLSATTGSRPGATAPATTGAPVSAPAGATRPKPPTR